MAIEFVTAKTLYTTSTFGSSSSATTSRPPGLKTGDYLFLFIYLPISASSNDPVGWTPYKNYSTASVRVMLYYREIANISTEPTEYTIGIGVTTQFAMHIVCYRGVRSVANDGLAPWYNAAYAYDDGTNTAITAPSLSAAVGTMTLYFHVWEYATLANFTSSGAVAGSGDLVQRSVVNSGMSDHPVTSYVHERDQGNVTGACGSVTGTAYSGAHSLAATILLTYTNAAPLAPVLNEPTDGAFVSTTDDTLFSWTPQDDPWDSMDDWNMRYRIVGAGSWNTVPGSGNVPTDPSVTFPAGSLAAGDYEWQVSTGDTYGYFGPWSASSFFTVGTRPATPTIVHPTLDELIDSFNYDVEWSATNQDAFEIRRVADFNGLPTSVTLSSIGVLVNDVARAYGLGFPIDNTTEHVQVRVKYNDLWSDWASVRVSVNYQEPATPTLALAVSGTTIVCTITNPAGGAALGYNEIWVDDGLGAGYVRVATGLDPDATYVYQTPRFGYDYDGHIFCRAVASIMSIADSAHV